MGLSLGTEGWCRMQALSAYVTWNYPGIISVPRGRTVEKNCCTYIHSSGKYMIQKVELEVQFIKCRKVVQDFKLWSLEEKEEDLSLR